MEQAEEQNRKTAFDRDRVRSQMGTPLAPQVARNPEEQEKSAAGGREEPQEEAETEQRDPRAEQQKAAAGAVEAAAEKIPVAGAVVSGFAKNFPILWLLIGWAKKLNAKSVFLQIIVKVLIVIIGPFAWPVLMVISPFSMGLLPKSTLWEWVTVLFVLAMGFLVQYGGIILFFYLTS
ncbi:MAG: hypothetical protein Q7S48_02440 [bacterium]|nr:hypothetical protein [bacterium]